MTILKRENVKRDYSEQEHSKHKKKKQIIPKSENLKEDNAGKEK